MLLGLSAAALPVLIHLWNRRLDPVVEWGAMQFLDFGRATRRRIKLTERLLMLARMGLLAAVALAMARPFLTPTSTAGMATRALDGRVNARGSRDVVLILDASSGTGRVSNGATARARAIAWARAFVRDLPPGDAVAVLEAGDRVRPVVDPPALDRARVDAALEALGRTQARGSADIPSALAAAFRLLETARNPGRDVVILTDGRRAPWRPGEPSRWALVRELARRLPATPRVFAATFRPGEPSPDDPPDGSISAPSLSRATVTPGLPLAVTAEAANAGPGPLSRTAELLVDGRPLPGSAQPVGPLPAGGRVVLTFRTAFAGAGSHLLTVKLDGDDDALPANDEASTAVEVSPPLKILLVDGEPGREPLSGETDFLRAALAPGDDDTPQAVARVVAADRLTPASFDGYQVVVLANVERLSPDVAAALNKALGAGLGLLVAPGGRSDPAFYNALAGMPATLGPAVGKPAAKSAVAHPTPSSFAGAALSPFARGEAPPLAAAALFSYRKLGPRAGASVSARLDTGDPWVVEGPQGRGRVLMVAGPLDAEGGTLPVNPDFVPLVHEWALSLAGPGPSPNVGAGEPLAFERPASVGVGGTASVQTPSGAAMKTPTTLADGRLRARFDDTAEPGVYRLNWPDPPGGSSYAVVRHGFRGSAPGPDPAYDPAPLEPAETARLAQHWPAGFFFEPAPDTTNGPAFTARLLAPETTGPAPRREFWRGLVLLALAGLCVEVYLTRRLVRGHGFGLDPAA